MEGAAWSPCNTMRPEPRPTFIASGILMHPAVWPQQTWAEKWGGLCPIFGDAKLGPHLTQRRLARLAVTPPYQVAS